VAPTSDDLPFDTVATGDGRRRSVPEFFALPLTQRIKMILDNQLTFFRGQEPIDVHVGLQALMKVKRPN